MQDESYPALKVCSTCREPKPRENFHRHARSSDGRRAQCKSCRYEYTVAKAEQIAAYQRQWRQANREQIAAYGRAQREEKREELKARRRGYYLKGMDKTKAANRQYKERTNYAPRWRAKNQAQIRAYDERYRAENPDKVREATRRWRLANPEKTRMAVRRRRVRRHEAGGSFTLRDWTDLCARYGQQCLACGVTNVPLSPDHVIPLSKGGTNGIENIQPLCRPCNLRKGTKSTDYRGLEQQPLF